MDNILTDKDIFDAAYSMFGDDSNAEFKTIETIFGEIKIKTNNNHE